MDEPSDRISSLPNDVLTHVLSFLTAKEAVQTCILSKRWRNVWASVPVLRFLFDDFIGGVCDDDNYDDELKFDRFVQGVFENRGQSRLDTIIYDWRFVNDYYTPSLVWLERATLLMPRTISVCIWGVVRLSFPHSVFSCASLQNLHLSLSTEVRPKLIALPSLERMHVCTASFALRKERTWVKTSSGKLLIRSERSSMVQCSEKFFLRHLASSAPLVYRFCNLRAWRLSKSTD